MRLLVTRPDPDASRQAETLAARGHQPVLAPLLEIRLRQDVELPLAGAQALIVTSRNALRALAGRTELVEARKLPLYAVGEATAQAASELGFARVIAGPGTGKELAAQIQRELAPDGGPLVHLAGETLAFDLAGALSSEGFKAHQKVLYSVAPAEQLPPKAVDLLETGRLDGVILMSPRTAATFAELISRHGLVTEASGLRCYCLSEAVTDALKPLNCKLLVAARPKEEDLLALIDSEAASSG